jgi:hypothetical protein
MGLDSGRAATPTASGTLTGASSGLVDEGFTATGSFRKARVKPIKHYGVYRGTGRIRFSLAGLQISGRRTRSLGTRWAIGLGLFLGSLILSGGRLALSFIPIYLLVEYVFLEPGDVFVRWSSVRTFSGDQKKGLVAIQIDCSDDRRDVVVLKTDSAGAALDLLERQARGIVVGPPASKPPVAALAAGVSQQPRSPFAATLPPFSPAPGDAPQPPDELPSMSSSSSSPSQVLGQSFAVGPSSNSPKDRPWLLPAVIIGIAFMTAVTTLALSSRIGSKDAATAPSPGVGWVSQPPSPPPALPQVSLPVPTREEAFVAFLRADPRAAFSPAMTDAEILKVGHTICWLIDSGRFASPQSIVDAAVESRSTVIEEVAASVAYLCPEYIPDEVLGT